MMLLKLLFFLSLFVSTAYSTHFFPACSYEKGCYYFDRKGSWEEVWTNGSCILKDAKPGPLTKIQKIYFFEKRAPSSINIDEGVVERRGCCSWHLGVCGCSEGRAYCCDGSLSPSCGCD